MCQALPEAGITAANKAAGVAALGGLPRSGVSGSLFPLEMCTCLPFGCPVGLQQLFRAANVC